MTNIATSEVLDLAADAIQMAGWGKGPASWDLDNGQGLCIEGAIGAVIGIEQGTFGLRRSELTACPAYRAMRAYLESPVLYVWNDMVAKSEEDVVAALRAAAAVERTKEAVAFRGYETEDQPLPLDEKAVA